MTQETIEKIIKNRDLYLINQEIRKARTEKDLPWLSAIDVIMDELHKNGFWLTREENYDLGDLLPDMDVKEYSGF